MRPGIVRPIAICIFRRTPGSGSRDDSILVGQFRDPIKDQTFYRPLGGSIEFGEYSRQTIERELMEELGAAVADLRYLATIENVFVYNGQTGHEIVLVYEGRLVDPALYECERLEGFEDNGLPFPAVWQRLNAFCDTTPLYPTGLLELLKTTTADEPAL